MAKYSKNLIDELINCLYEDYHIQIDENKAEQYLNSLADLYFVLSKDKKMSYIANLER